MKKLALITAGCMASVTAAWLLSCYRRSRLLDLHEPKNGAWFQCDTMDDPNEFCADESVPKQVTFEVRTFNLFGGRKRTAKI